MAADVIKTKILNGQTFDIQCGIISSVIDLIVKFILLNSETDFANSTAFLQILQPFSQICDQGPS